MKQIRERFRKKLPFLFGATFLLSILAGLPAAQDDEKADETAGKKNPFVGTWIHERKVKFRGKKKKLALHIVIREAGETPSVRYQVSYGTRVFTSDWDGKCVFSVERAVKCYHQSTFSGSDDGAKIRITTKITYSGTMKGRKGYSEGYYFIEKGDEGNRLIHRVTLFKIGDKTMPGPADVIYERLSDSVEWEKEYSRK